MIELVCIFVGAAGALLARYLWQRREPTVAATDARTPTVPIAPPAPTRTPTTPATAPIDALQVARSLADELATLVSGVEGRTHHLIEAAPDRSQLPLAAEELLTAVQRLRTLHSKLVAFTKGRANEPGRTVLEALLVGLGDELPQMQLGLEVRRESAAHVPPIGVGPGVVHDALLFLCAALLRAERGASNLAINTELCFAGDEPCVEIELALEWCTEALPPAEPVLTDPAFTLDLEAANHLVTSNGGELSISHLPGRAVRAVVRWPLLRQGTECPDAEPPASSSSEPAPADDRAMRSHHYGGALVLESDPAVRALLSRELKAVGRAVFACADSAAARTFLEATPDRFELLILDHAQRLDGGDALGGTIRALAPQLKIVVLTAAPPTHSPDWPQLRHLQKPFGVHELRAALASFAIAG